MGLPLYTPPIESDLRTNNTTPSTQNANRVRRTRRRSSDALREIRRRAILTEAVSQAVSSAPSDPEREREQGSREQASREGNNRHASRMRLERQARALETDYLDHHQLIIENARRQTALHDFMNDTTPWPSPRNREALLASMRQHLDRGRQILTDELNAVNDPAFQRSIQRFLANIPEPDQLNENPAQPAQRSAANPAGLPSASNAANALNALNAPNAANINSARNYHVPPMLPPSDPRSQYLGMTRPRGPSTHEIAPTPSYGQSIASTDQPTANEHYSNTFVGALNHELAQAAGRQQRWATSGPFPADEPEQGLRSTTDHFMGFDEPEPPRPPRRRLTSSLRRVAAAPSNTARRPTVGWSDSAHPPPALPSARAVPTSATSRIFGDISQIRNGPEAASARQYGWAVRYIDSNGVDRPAPPSADLLSNNQIDGLGDRHRSLSPEGDGVWDTLLSTLTPDPQGPSLGSSFASTTEALAAAAAHEQPSSSQPTVVPTPNLSAPPAVPSPTTRRGDESDSDHASLASALHPSAAARAQLAAVIAASRASNSVSPAGESSGRTSATASQRIRSPFTAASAGTSTGDESAVLGGVGLEDDDGCDDSDNDHHHEYYDMDMEDECEDDLVEFLGLGGAPSPGRIGHLRADANHQRLMHEQMQLQHGLTRQIQLQHERSMNMNSSSSSNNNNNNNNNGNNNSAPRPRAPPIFAGPLQTHSDESLDSLGIGGMQHIVRSLARREDIPDEWWAEAGLSRNPEGGN